MGSNHFSSSSYDLKWTPEQYKLFENALAIYDQENIPDRWQKIAKLVGGTNEEEVKRQYEILLDDIKHIESGEVPLPKYTSNERSSSSRFVKGIANEEQRLKHLKL